MTSRVLSFGSLNVDHVHRVPRFPRPGETLVAHGYARRAGGKGANQAAALAGAGAVACLAGRIGADGLWLLEALQARGVDTRHVEVTDEPTGHASIQVDDAGENSIVVHPGANATIPEARVDAVLAAFERGDWLVVQHETNAVERMIERGAARGMRVVLNPAPVRPTLAAADLSAIDTLVVNEEEGAALVGAGTPREIVSALRARCPGLVVVLTLGSRGALCAAGDRVIEQPALPVEAVDTTAAGDTFVGFFVAARARGESLEQALAQAARAAALCVSRPGALDSIPTREEASRASAS